MPTNIVVCLCYPLVVAIIAALVGFSLITWGDLSSSPDGIRQLQTHPRQRWGMSRSVQFLHPPQATGTELYCISQLYKYARKGGKGGVSGRNSSGKRYVYTPANARLSVDYTTDNPQKGSLRKHVVYATTYLIGTSRESKHMLSGLMHRETVSHTPYQCQTFHQTMAVPWGFSSMNSSECE